MLSGPAASAAAAAAAAAAAVVLLLLARLAVMLDQSDTSQTMCWI
jgi:hypothetical protein